MTTTEPTELLILKKKAADREIERPKHDFALLNGEATRAKTIILEQPFTNGEELVKKFAGSGNGKYGRSYDTLDNSLHKKILLHMPDVKIIEYFTSKGEEAKQKIIDAGLEILYLLDEASESKERIGKKNAQSMQLITSTEAILNKLSDRNSDAAKGVAQNIASLREELDKPHPNEDEIDSFISLIEENAGNLIDKEKAADAIDYANSLIQKVENALGRKDIPEDEIPHFNLRNAELRMLIGGSDILLIEETATAIDRELIEKTDKVLRSNTRALTGTLRNLVRIMLHQIYATNEKRFNPMIDEILNIKIAAAYTQYKNGLGKIARKGDSSKIFPEVLKGILFITTQELELINSGDDKIESVLNSLPDSIMSLSNFDNAFTDFQLSVPGIDVSSSEAQISSSKEFLKKIRETASNELIDNTGCTQREADDIVQGPLFTDALQYIPTFIFEQFSAHEEEERKKAEKEKKG